MSNQYDLDLAFTDEAAEPDLSTLTDAELASAVASLPLALREVAIGILVEKRTMSDVSQALGIRQSELVTRLHRAKTVISESAS